MDHTRLKMMVLRINPMHAVNIILLYSILYSVVGLLLPAQFNEMTEMVYSSLYSRRTLLNVDTTVSVQYNESGSDVAETS